MAGKAVGCRIAMRPSKRRRLPDTPEGRLQERELWIRAHSRLGKIPVVLTLLGLSSSLECTTKPSNFPLWGEKVFFPASWRGLLNLQKGRPD